MDRIRSALFLDFDNIFSGLMALDRRAALAMVEDTTGWLDRLAVYSTPPGTHRDFLVRRAYLNPNAWIQDDQLGNEAGRLYLQRFRPDLTRAGFEVVDCPALTRGQKNAADIRIVIDVLGNLDAPVHYDEFIVASSDADFTPLLRRLKAFDRRTTIMAAGPTASAYHCIADVHLDDAALVRLFTPEPVGTSSGAGRSSDEGASDGPATKETVERATVEMIAESDEPLFLATLGHMLRERFASLIDQEPIWFGSGGLSDFIRSIQHEPAFELNGYHVWLPDRHDEPQEMPGQQPPVELPPLIAQVCRVTGMPRVASENWKALFEVLARYGEEHGEFNFSECTAWARDALTEHGRPVGRQSIGFVVRALVWRRFRLDADVRPTAEAIRDAFADSMIDRAAGNSLALSAGEEEALRAWLGGIVIEEPADPSVID